MRIIDITDKYQEYILRGNDSAAYEESYPALFEHYCHYWGKRVPFTAPISEAEMVRNRALLNAGLGRIEACFARAWFDIAEMPVALFVGQDVSNGHAFEDHGEFVVWLPIETYTSHEKVDVFVTHEIIHALHYQAAPEFYFRTRSELYCLSRRLITEGIATFLTAAVLGIDDEAALWADYLDDHHRREWMAQCRNNRVGLARFMIDRFNDSDPETDIFRTADAGDIFRFRGGYYVGLEVIRAVAAEHGLTMKQLLSLRRPHLEELALNKLREMAG